MILSMTHTIQFNISHLFAQLKGQSILFGP